MTQELLPAVAEACGAAARALAAAFADVEAGREVDHPKLTCLGSCLLCFRSLHPVRETPHIT